MTITSVGYAGSITDDNWRRMATAAVGSTYGVDDYASWRVTPGTGDRATKIAPGGGFGLGVRDYSDEDVIKTHSPVAAGSRWDLIVAHRNWSTRVTTFEVIEGTGVKALPNRANGFGTPNDQPIALARFAAGSTEVQEIVDLRCIPGDGGMIAFDELARQYLDRLGTTVRIGDAVWARRVSSLGSPEWVSEGQRRHAILRGKPQSFNGPGDYTRWSFDNPGSFRTGDEFTLESGVYVRTARPGRYRGRASIAVPNGSGVGVLAFYCSPGNGGQPFIASIKPAPLLGSYGNVVEFEIPSISLAAGGGFALRNEGGVWTIGGERPDTHLYIESLD